MSILVCRKCGKASPDGSHFCANPSCGAYLEWDADRVEDPEEAPGANAGSVADAAPASIPEKARDRRSDDPTGAASRRGVVLALFPGALAAKPGAEQSATVEVRNTGALVDEFGLAVLVAPASTERSVGSEQNVTWATAEPPDIKLYPDRATPAEVKAVFRPPRSPDVPAGQYRFVVVATSTQDASTSHRALGTVEVEPWVEVRSSLSPRTSTGTAGAQHRLTLDNRSNMHVDVAIDVSDPDEVLDCRPATQTVSLRPGEQAALAIAVTPRHPITGGNPQQRPFAVTVITNGGPSATLAGLHVQEPVAPHPESMPGHKVLSRHRALRSYGRTWVAVLVLSAIAIAVKPVQHRLETVKVIGDWVQQHRLEVRNATNDTIIGLLVLAALLAGLAVVRAVFTTYVIYERRVDVARGVLNPKRRSVWLYDITDISYQRTLLMLLLDTARIDLTCNSAGSRLRTQTLIGLARAGPMRAIFDDLQDRVMVERRAKKHQDVG